MHPGIVYCCLQIQTQLANHVAAVGPAILVGIACGVLATVFTVLNIKVVRLRDTIIQVSTGFSVLALLVLYRSFLATVQKKHSKIIKCPRITQRNFVLAQTTAKERPWWRHSANLKPTLLAFVQPYTLLSDFTIVQSMHRHNSTSTNWLG